MVVVVRSYWPQSLYCQMDKTGDCGRTPMKRNLHLTGRYGIIWDFASHVSKSPDMIIKTAALNVIPLTPGLISKTTCAAFLNQFHPFLVRTFGMPLNHSCPTPLLCTMSILDKQHFTLNQTCPMS